MELDVEVLVVDDLVGGLVLGVGVDVGVYTTILYTCVHCSSVQFYPFSTVDGAAVRARTASGRNSRMHPRPPTC